MNSATALLLIAAASCPLHGSSICDEMDHEYCKEAAACMEVGGEHCTADGAAAWSSNKSSHVCKVYWEEFKDCGPCFPGSPCASPTQSDLCGYPNPPCEAGGTCLVCESAAMCFFDDPIFGGCQNGVRKWTGEFSSCVGWDQCAECFPHSRCAGTSYVGDYIPNATKLPAGPGSAKAKTNSEYARCTPGSASAANCASLLAGNLGAVCVQWDTQLHVCECPKLMRNLWHYNPRPECMGPTAESHAYVMDSSCIGGADGCSVAEHPMLWFSIFTMGMFALPVHSVVLAYMLATWARFAHLFCVKRKRQASMQVFVITTNVMLGVSLVVIEACALGFTIYFRDLGDEYERMTVESDFERIWDFFNQIHLDFERTTLICVCVMGFSLPLGLLSVSFAWVRVVRSARRMQRKASKLSIQSKATVALVSITSLGFYAHQMRHALQRLDPDTLATMQLWHRERFDSNMGDLVYVITLVVLVGILAVYVYVGTEVASITEAKSTGSQRSSEKSTGDGNEAAESEVGRSKEKVASGRGAKIVRRITSTAQHKTVTCKRRCSLFCCGANSKLPGVIGLVIKTARHLSWLLLAASMATALQIILLLVSVDNTSRMYAYETSGVVSRVLLSLAAGRITHYFKVASGVGKRPRVHPSSGSPLSTNKDDSSMRSTGRSPKRSSG